MNVDPLAYMHSFDGQATQTVTAQSSDEASVKES